MKKERKKDAPKTVRYLEALIASRKPTFAEKRNGYSNWRNCLTKWRERGND